LAGNDDDGAADGGDLDADGEDFEESDGRSRPIGP